MNELHLCVRGWTNERSNLEPFEIQPKSYSESSVRASQRESECGEWLNINGLSGSSWKIDPVCLGKEQQNVPSWGISEEGTKLLNSEGINFKHLPG